MKGDKRVSKKRKVKRTKKTVTKKKNSLLLRSPRVTEFLRTGSTQLDLAISCNKAKYGGIPTRRIIEFSGTGASGKTYICGEIAGDALRKGYDVYVDDIERRWDFDRLDTFGFTYDHKRFHYIDPSSSVEQCFETLFKTLDKVIKRKRSGDDVPHVLYIIDPIAALYALQELKSDKMGQARAKAIQKYMRFLKDRVSTSEAVISVIFSNQLIDNVGGGMFDSKKTTPGGNALIHWPSVRVRFKSPGKLVDKRKVGTREFKIVKGVKLRAEVTKNSEDDAFRTAEFTIEFKHGIDDVRDNVEWLRTHTDVLGTSGTWLSLPTLRNSKGKLVKRKQVQGITAFVKHVEDNYLERRLGLLVGKYYRQWYETETRKPKVRW